MIYLFHVPKQVLLPVSFEDYFGVSTLKQLGEMYAAGYAQEDEDPSSEDFKKAEPYLKAAIEKAKGKMEPRRIELMEEYLQMTIRNGKRREEKEKTDKEALAKLPDALKEAFLKEQANVNREYADERRKKTMTLPSAVQLRMDADKAAFERLKQRLAREGW